MITPLFGRVKFIFLTKTNSTAMNNKIYLILFLLLPFLFVNEIKALDFAIKGITVEAPFPHEVKKFCDHIKNDLAPSGVNTLMLRIDYKFKFDWRKDLKDDQY